MKCSLLFVVISVVAALLLTKCHVAAQRNIKDYVGQQPLLFGRRGVNPNMNSLFFGKRGGINPGLSLKDFRDACSMILPYLDEAETTANEEV
ncbi:hypothetical protein BsWGS_25559 [Bradybaena similaris]